MNSLQQKPNRSHSALVPPRVAADLADVATKTVQAWLADGAIHSERIGGKVFVSLDDTLARARESAIGTPPAHEESDPA